MSSLIEIVKRNVSKVVVSGLVAISLAGCASTSSRPAQVASVGSIAPSSYSQSADSLISATIVPWGEEFNTHNYTTVSLLSSDLDTQSHTTRTALRALSRTYGSQARNFYATEIESRAEGLVLDKVAEATEQYLGIANGKGRLFGVALESAVAQIADYMRANPDQEIYHFQVGIPNRFFVQEMDVYGEIDKSALTARFYQRHNGETHLLWESSIAVGGVHFDESIEENRAFETSTGIRYISRFVENRMWISPDWNGEREYRQGVFEALGAVAAELSESPEPIGFGHISPHPNNPEDLYGGHLGGFPVGVPYNGEMLHASERIDGRFGRASHGCVSNGHATMMDLFGGITEYNGVGVQTTWTGTVHTLSYSIPTYVSE